MRSFNSNESTCNLSRVPGQFGDFLDFEFILKVHGLKYSASQIFLLYDSKILLHQLNCAIKFGAIVTEISINKDAIIFQNLMDSLEKGLNVTIAVRALYVEDNIS